MLLYLSTSYAQVLDTAKVGLKGELKEHTVSGALPDRAKSPSPVPIEIFSHQFFKKNPSNSLFESLQMINGVQPTINCNVCNTGDIHINGLEGPYTLVLIDGMPMVSALSSVYGLSGIPNGMIDRVEIVKGPAASLYGSEAMGGLINVITKNAGSGRNLQVDYFGSSYLENNLDLAYQERKGKLGYFISGNFFAFNNRVDINEDHFTDLALQNRASLFTKFQYARKPLLSSSMAARVYTENRFGGELNWTPAFRGGDSVYGESVYTRRVELIALHPFKLAGENFRFQFSYNYHYQNSAYGRNLFLARQSGLFAQLLYDKPIGANNLVLAGFTFRLNNYTDQTVAKANGDLGRNSIPGVFVQDQIAFNHKHTLLAGARLDYYNVHGPVFSPRLNYKWQLPYEQTLRFSAGNGFRVVNVFTEDHAALTGARRVVVENGLKPEKSVNLNVQYAKWMNSKYGYFEWDASLFYSFFQNKIVPNYDANPDEIIYANTEEKCVSRGLTLNVVANFLFPVKLNAGITCMQVFNSLPDSLGNLNRQDQIHAPRFSGTFQLSYFPKRSGLVFDLTGQLYGPMRLPVQPNDYRPEYSPTYCLMNIQISKKFKKGLECYGGIKNVLNFLPKDPLMRPFDPFDKHASDQVQNPMGYTFDTTYNYAPMQAIRFFLGFRYNFAF